MAKKNMRVSKEWKIGLISVVIVLLFVWVGFFLAGRNILSKENTFYAVFDQTGGINISGPVVINGKKVGRISQIEFVSPTDHRIKVGIGVRKKYPISKGSVASIESFGLMSGSGIVIYLGGEEGFLRNGDYLQGRMVPDLMASLSPMQARMESILSSLDSVMASINRVLDRKAVADLNTGIASMRASLQNVERLTGEAGRLVSDNREKIDRVVSNAESLSRMLADNQDELSSAIGNFSAIGDTLARANISRTMFSLQESLAQAQELVSKVNEGKGSVGQLLNNDTLYRNLEKSSRQLDLLLQDLRVNPERYVHISVFGRKEKKKDKPAAEI